MARSLAFIYIAVFHSLAPAAATVEPGAVLGHVASLLATHDPNGTNGSNHTTHAPSLNGDDAFKDDALMFIGGITLFSLLFYMTHKPHGREVSYFFCGSQKKIRRFTWTWIRTTLSIFIAVLTWYLAFRLIVQRKELLKEAGLNEVQLAWGVLLLVWWVFLAIVLVYIASVYIYSRFFLAKSEDYNATMCAILAIYAHIVGFALLNLIAYIQDLFVAIVALNHPEVVIVLPAFISWFVATLFFAFMFWLLHKYVMRNFLRLSMSQQDFSPRELSLPARADSVELVHKLDEHLDEFLTESLALGTSYGFLRVLIALVEWQDLSALPEVMMTSGSVKNTKDKLFMLGLCVLCTIVALLWAQIAPCFKRSTFLCKEFLQTFFTFVSAFAWLQLFRWVLYDSQSGAEHDILLHMIMGFVVSFAALIFVSLWMMLPCVCACAGEVVTISAILAAFTWELCLDMMAEQLDEAKFPAPFAGLNEKFLFMEDPLLFLFLFSLWAILVPLFINGVYHNSMDYELYTEDKDKDTEDIERDDELIEDFEEENGYE